MNFRLSSMSGEAADVNGFVPINNQHMLDRVYRHSGNNEMYITIKFVWMSELDQWGLLHAKVKEPGIMSKVECIRSVTNFFSDREGVPRFALIGPEKR